MGKSYKGKPETLKVGIFLREMLFLLRVKTFLLSLMWKNENG